MTLKGPVELLCQSWYINHSWCMPTLWMRWPCCKVPVHKNNRTAIWGGGRSAHGPGPSVVIQAPLTPLLKTGWENEGEKLHDTTLSKIHLWCPQSISYNCHVFCTIFCEPFKPYKKLVHLSLMYCMWKYPQCNTAKMVCKPILTFSLCNTVGSKQPPIQFLWLHLTEKYKHFFSRYRKGDYIFIASGLSWQANKTRNSDAMIPCLLWEWILIG